MARHNIVFGRDQAVQQGGSAYSGPRFGQAAQSGLHYLLLAYH